MPSDRATLVATGRCYCGSTHISADVSPFAAVTCHCDDCRRVSGAPSSTYAAFFEGQVRVIPQQGPPVTVTEGVARWFCRACGSPLAAQFTYLPGQIFVPIGVLDQAGLLVPQVQGFARERLPWIGLSGHGRAFDGSAAAALLKAAAAARA